MPRVDAGPSPVSSGEFLDDHSCYFNISRGSASLSRAYTRIGLDTLVDSDIIIVPFWRDPAEKPDQGLLEALMHAHKRGSRLVRLCLGTYVLAYTGLLDNRKAATHWEFEQDFNERFPNVYLDDHRASATEPGVAGVHIPLG